MIVTTDTVIKYSKQLFIAGFISGAILMTFWVNR